jgi:hypothetical protein
MSIQKRNLGIQTAKATQKSRASRLKVMQIIPPDFRFGPASLRRFEKVTETTIEMVKATQKC